MTHQTDSMTVTQTARTLGVHRRTIDRLLARGRLHRNSQTRCILNGEVLAVKAERAEAAYQQLRERLIQKLVSQAMEATEQQKAQQKA